MESMPSNDIYIDDDDCCFYDIDGRWGQMWLPQSSSDIKHNPPNHEEARRERGRMRLLH
jgi:hypothetical protein